MSFAFSKSISYAGLFRNRSQISRSNGLIPLVVNLISIQIYKSHDIVNFPLVICQGS